MFAIGVEMMMEAMVNVLEPLFPYHDSCMTLSLIHHCYCAVVLFRSREHENCGPQPGYIRAHIESKFSHPLLLMEYF